MAKKPRNPLRRLAGSPEEDHQEKGSEIDEALFRHLDAGRIKEAQEAGGPQLNARPATAQLSRILMACSISAPPITE